MLTLCTALAAFLGTVLQIWSSLEQIHQLEAERTVFRTVDGMRFEIPRRHPIKRWSQRKLVRQILRESPDEAQLYWRMWRVVTGWSLLAGAAAAAVVGSFVEVVR